ncbi:hypothetical protein HDU97_005140 [Phlyctochytrium planicorne]|nr:hypothetical protein HDU97_005140 [Phlyctochytrium planicorne]
MVGSSPSSSSWSGGKKSGGKGSVKKSFGFSGANSSGTGGIKPSRASTWSFKTKYPRLNKGSSGRSGGGGGSRGKNKSVYSKSSSSSSSNRITGLVLPSRLKLADMRRGDRWHAPGESKDKKQESATRTDSSRWEKSKESAAGGKRNSVKKPVAAAKPRRMQSGAVASGSRPGLGASTRPRAATATPRTRGLSREEELELVKKQYKREQAKSEWESAQAAHAAKFQMDPLDATISHRSELKKQIKSITFDGMGLRPEILESLVKLFGESAKPTPVQALAIPPSLKETREGRALLVGAETGSGKTIAYLVPIMQRLREQEAKEAVELASETDDMMKVVDAVLSHQDLMEENPKIPMFKSRIREPGVPRAVILVPTRDLVTQVTKVAKSLCAHTARLTVVGVHSKSRREESVKRKVESSPMDILVCTPKVLAEYWQESTLRADRVGEVVVDEADTLMDGSFMDELDDCFGPILRAGTMRGDPALFTFVSATFPKTMVKRLNELHPQHIRIATPRLHRTVPGLRQNFMKISGSDTKQSLLLETLKMGRNSGDRRVVVFCNRRETAEWVGDFLKGKGFHTGVITAFAEASERNAVLKAFSGARVEADRSRYDQGDIVPEDQFRVLVATDAVSRGLDTVAVDHVVLYDFPHTSIDYLHRVGRTARNGAGGRATSFVTKRDMALALAIESASARGEMLA